MDGGVHKRVREQWHDLLRVARQVEEALEGAHGWQDRARRLEDARGEHVEGRFGALARADAEKDEEYEDSEEEDDGDTFEITMDMGGDTGKVEDVLKTRMLTAMPVCLCCTRSYFIT